MKLTKPQLRRIIKEEIENVKNEGVFSKLKKAVGLGGPSPQQKMETKFTMAARTLGQLVADVKEAQFTKKIKYTDPTLKRDLALAINTLENYTYDDDKYEEDNPLKLDLDSATREIEDITGKLQSASGI